MYKAKLFLMFLFISITNNYASRLELTSFRFNYYVYYEILYKIQGIKPQEFVNITVIEDTNMRLVFEYKGQQYRAFNLAKGAIKVEMPEGLSDRYLTRGTHPALILSQY